MRKPEDISSNRFTAPRTAMDSLLSGDAMKCSRLSLMEKRQLVHEIVKRPEDAPKVLSSLTRRELLEIICAEMGKERKYSGFTKFRMIQHLLKVVSGKSNMKEADEQIAPSPTQTVTGLKRQRRQQYLSQLPVESDPGRVESSRKEDNVILCQNLACRATLSFNDGFCRRCSCCICHQYDDNKDPSLWLTCDYESIDAHESCGMSCHLKCVLVKEWSGMTTNGCGEKLDGKFYCVSCRKINGLMRTWRKQLVVAKEARRVDVLCLRVWLSQKILEGTKQFKELLEIVESVVVTLENEVGPLDKASANMDRGIVNRLSCGPAVQKLCSSAIEAFDAVSIIRCFDHENQKISPACQIQFEGLSPTAVTIVLKYDDCLSHCAVNFKLWYRKSNMEYSAQAAFDVLDTRLKLNDLDPSTEYFCKVSFSNTSRTLGVYEARWTTPLAPSNQYQGEKDNLTSDSTSIRTESMSSNDDKVTFVNNLTKPLPLNGVKKFPALPPYARDIPCVVPLPSAPSTPCKSDGRMEVTRMGGKKQPEESDYEYSVRVIRRLEHEGHLDTDFRVKFLTWFSLKATAQQRTVVSVYIKTFSDDPLSLAGQLMDTFREMICSEQKPPQQHGFCTGLWH